MRKRDITQVIRETFPHAVVNHIDQYSGMYIVHFVDETGNPMDAEIREYMGIPVINYVGKH